MRRVSGKLTIKKQLSNIKEVDDSPGLFDPTPDPSGSKIFAYPCRDKSKQCLLPKNIRDLPLANITNTIDSYDRH